MGADLSRLSVIVLDDNRHMCTIIKQMLNSFGIRDVRLAYDAGDAFEELERRAADIAITDYMMQPLDGLEFTNMIRTAPDSTNPYMPIILITGYSEKKYIVAARDNGVNAVLCKPISPIDLYQRLAAVIERPRPFVKTGSYFGPDRRRGIQENFPGMERRSHPGANTENKRAG